MSSIYQLDSFLADTTKTILFIQVLYSTDRPNPGH